MKFRWTWWYLDNDGIPTTGRSHWRAKCLSFEWHDSVTVLFVGRVTSAETQETKPTDPPQSA